MQKLANVFTGILVLCALVVTGLFANREIERRQERHRAEFGVAVRGWSTYESQAGLPRDSAVPVRIAVFADYTCRFCARLDAVLDSLAPTFGRRLEVAHVHYPLFMGGTPLAAAIASECSRSQGRFHDYHQRLYANQAALDSIRWDDLAAEADVPDLTEFRACLSDPDTHGRVVQARALGDRIGVTVTPTMVINGRLFVGAPAAEVLQARILRAMQGG